MSFLTVIVKKKIKHESWPEESRSLGTCLSLLGRQGLLRSPSPRVQNEQVWSSSRLSSQPPGLFPLTPLNKTLQHTATVQLSKISETLGNSPGLSMAGTDVGFSKVVT